MAVAGDGEVHHVRAGHSVVHDVGALHPRAFNERRRYRRRGQPHVTRDRDALRLEIGHEAAADQASGVFIDLARVQTADVVRLEDCRIDGHSLL